MTYDCQADPLIHEARLGLLGHDVDGVWSGSSGEEGIDFNGELIFSPSALFLGGLVRPNLGLSLNSSGYTSKIYGGGVLEYVSAGGLFLDFGLGLTIHNGEIDNLESGDSALLGSPLLFRVSFEAGVALATKHRVSLMFDHISNAYLAEPNKGLDTLGIRYGYLFSVD